MTISTTPGPDLKHSSIPAEKPFGPPLTVSSDYWNYIVRFAIVFAVYVVAGKLGQATTEIRSNNLGPVWPAYGVALAAILLCGYRVWPAVALGIFVVAASSPEPYLTALGQTAGATLAVLIGTFLLHRIAEFDNSLSRLRDVLAFIVLGALGSAIVSASIGTVALHASQIHSYTGFGSAWLIYWMGDSTGALLVTPLILTFPNLWRIRNWSRWAEFCCLLAILVAICRIVFGDLAVVPVRMIAFAVLPLVMWAAIRFGVGGAALSIFTVATVAAVETALGSGSFVGSTPFINGVQLDAFYAVLSLAGLTFAAVYTERELAQLEREQSLREQVAIEVRLQDQELLRDSEQRFRLAAQVGKMYSFEWNVITDEVVRSSEHANVLGVTEPLRPTHQQFMQKIHPDDAPKFNATTAGLTPENPTAEVIYRVPTFDGGLVWLRSRARGFFDGDGKLRRVIGMVADITDLKRAEEALSGVSGKLVEAQEQERARIARELHDDIAQRLALLAVELQHLQQSHADLPSEQRALIDAIYKQTTEISTDVQSMSHKLHSSKLEYLGIVAAMRSFCKELSVQQKVEIDFKSDGVPTHLSQDISLCLFRVLQEALHNSVKHSGVRHFDVQLREDAREIHLDISDSGQGFEIEAATQGQGLGLISMRERVRLVNGMIAIESKPMSGTSIRVRVPFKSEETGQRATG